ncbi:HAD-IIA family hydrolase [Caldilinea sp.]|uniref:HAD-IIA family hydrolase n=1 Tax=Caldilinea sp. TaxID=2293560 RepID=UPI0021DECD1A|nr:HAD-IIA family hydrolase [Caldilinea sp.]GIV69780.1 MAG: acid sugar phosphatase [Caldilinea sp.]
MMTDSIHPLSRIRAVLFDMDGVIYVGNRPLPGVQELLDYLDATGRRWMLVTNNAALTSQQFSDKVAAMGLRVPPERILGSAEATASWLRHQVEKGWPEGKVIVNGQDGLRAALTAAGFELTSDPFEAAYAVSGANFKLTYDDLANVTLAIRNGARFIGTNSDRTYPTERGQVPGAGAILALFTAATDREPIVIGKPNAPMFEEAMRRLGVAPEETMMVGDRYETDIVGALKLGMLTVGVLTGVDTRATFEAQSAPPHLIVEGLPELLAHFQRADATQGVRAERSSP